MEPHYDDTPRRSLDWLGVLFLCAGVIVIILMFGEPVVSITPQPAPVVQQVETAPGNTTVNLCGFNCTYQGGSR